MYPFRQALHGAEGYDPEDDEGLALLQSVSMSAASPVFDDSNHLRAWRTFRGLTQMQLAVMVDVERATITHLESGRTQLTNRWMKRLGAALRIPPGFIIDRHPDDVPHDILVLWEAIPEDRRDLALTVLEGFKRAS